MYFDFNILHFYSDKFLNGLLIIYVKLFNYTIGKLSINVHPHKYGNILIFIENKLWKNYLKKVKK